MNFEYSEETKRKFEQMKPRQMKVDAFAQSDSLLTDVSSIGLEISKDFEDFLEKEFEKRGYTRDELLSGKHNLKRNIQKLENGDELHQYFIDGACVLGFYKKLNTDFEENSYFMGYKINAIN